MIFTKTFSRFVLPSLCVSRGKWDYFSERVGICRGCIPSPHRMDRNSHEKTCTICFLTPKKELSCNLCSDRNIFYKELFSLRWKGEQERDWMNLLKFHRAKSLQSFFSLGISRFLNHPKRNKTPFSYLISVPSSSQNRDNYISATSVLLNRLSQKLRLDPIFPLVKNSSQRQAKLDRKDRYFHAYSAFSLKPEYQNQLSGKVLLVDDVCTTGATVNEISRVLLQNGADSVVVLVQLRSNNGTA